MNLNQAAPARNFTHIAHKTRVVRVPDGDPVFPLKKQYDFDNGVTDIAGLSRALYGHRVVPEADKIDKVDETAKPADDEGDIHPFPPETFDGRGTDIGGRLLDPFDGAIGYRINKAGRRVQVDSLGSEIRRGSRRLVGRITTKDWKLSLIHI